MSYLGSRVVEDVDGGGIQVAGLVWGAGEETGVVTQTHAKVKTR